MTETLGDRIKVYENAYRTVFPPNSYVIVRVDGRAFHTFTKGLVRPFDDRFINAMNATATTLGSVFMGCCMAYVQSDEISLVITDCQSEGRELPYGGSLQKLVSISASVATRAFRQSFGEKEDGKAAEFDSRAFTVPNLEEVVNYFIWRQMDAIRNSVNSVGQSVFSHKELQGLKVPEVKALLKTKDVDWDDLPKDKRQGRVAVRETYEISGEEGTVIRSRWVSRPAPHFLTDKDFIRTKLPVPILAPCDPS